jgi:hypothetical protein
MFRKNDKRQKSLFGAEMQLSVDLQKRLAQSWALTFRQEVFERIDEEIFAKLYSEEKSRPNAPVNVLIGAEILKAGWGWSDEELYEAVCFDMRVRYGLGIEDVGGEPPFQLRTLYNFRRRVREHAVKTGENLYQKVFEQVTDEQLQQFSIKTSHQRMDSTQVLSNLAQGGRLELLVSVLQQVVKGVDEEKRGMWEEKAAVYLQKRPHEIGYAIRREDVNGHLHQIGLLLQGLQPHLTEGSQAQILAERVLREQYQQEGEGVKLRPAAEIASDSLQSPHDVEATYREKNGECYAGGYVVNASETCDEKNEVQLITDIQVANNVTDDGALLQQSLQNQKERGLEMKEVTTDGGYTGPESEAYCEQNNIDLRTTNVRGGKSKSGNMGWELYEWGCDEQGQFTKVSCPQGQVGILQPGRKPEYLTARFADRERCQNCPLLSACRVQLKKRVGPTFHVTLRSIQVALRRQALRPQDKSMRAPIEATMRSLKWPLRKNKLPVRGLTPALMYFSATALMVNLRRLHEQMLQNDSLPTIIYAIFAKLRRFHLLQTPSVSDRTLGQYFGLLYLLNAEFYHSLIIPSD